MVSIKKIACLGMAAVASAGSAPEVSDSPTDVTLSATFNKTIMGSVEFSSTNGSVKVDVKLLNLPSSGGPFLYHIHQKPVPTNGNCTATLGHFNPYNGSETATTPAGKEVGDLSGRHGTINGTSIDTSYIDPYLSLNSDDEAYFGGLSVVVHYANTTRLACANITEDSTSSSSSSSVSSDTSGAGALKVSLAGALPLAAGIIGGIAALFY